MFAVERWTDIRKVNNKIEVLDTEDRCHRTPGLFQNAVRLILSKESNFISHYAVGTKARRAKLSGKKNHLITDRVTVT